MTFEELNVNPEICKAILELGFEHPMPVQEKVIPLLLNERKDVVALAQTGTGKTAAYGIPLIQEAVPFQPNPRALILCPTRELCLQIAGDLNDFALYTDGVKILPVYGGSSIENQIKAIKKGVQIIAATPGRMLDLIRRGVVMLDGVERVVLDEADEMLNMGFQDDINDILAEVPENRITLLFSATMPNEVAAIAKKYMKHPLEVTIGTRNAGAENIKHICYTVQARDKYLALKRIADYNPGIYGIVFCRTRIETQEIADKLIQDGYNADSLHGDLSQAQRDFVMQKFRQRNLRMLVATDVAARGLDVNDLTHVINYNLPDDLDVYTHRSGRTGRSGKAGISVLIVNLKEKSAVKKIEKKIGKTFTHALVPSGREICEKQLFHLIDRMEKVETDDSDIDSYLPVIYKKLDWLEKEDVIKRFVSLEFNRFLEYYKNAKDLNLAEARPGERGSERASRGVKMTRLFINVGKKDGIRPNQLLEFINSAMPGRKVLVGRIDLMKSFSFFEVEPDEALDVINSITNLQLEGRRIFVELASEREKEGGGEYKEKKRSFGKEKRFGGKPDFKREKRNSEDERPSFHRERRKDDDSKPSYNRERRKDDDSKPSFNRERRKKDDSKPGFKKEFKKKEGSKPAFKKEFKKKDDFKKKKKKKKNWDD